ncbi:MAG: hypothetical protein WBP55_11570 [Solirubrobacterales bacterium]
MEITKSGLKRKTAICLATLAAAGLSLGVVACGGTDTESAASTASTGEATAAVAAAPGDTGGPFADLTDTQVQCLESEGVTAPAAPEAGAAPGQATGVTGEQGVPPAGGPPAGGPGGAIEGLEEAAAACDIDLPEPPSGGDLPQDLPEAAS